MREIKFRGYNGLEWLYTEMIRYVSEDDFWQMMNNETGEWDCVSFIGQYTGLKDKNGAEIYEGDIGRWHIARENESILFNVLWIEEEARFMGRYRDEYGNYRFINLINSDKALEIIGNIYENLELLELRS